MCKQWAGACAAGALGLIMAWSLPAQAPGPRPGQAKAKGWAPIVEGPTIWLKEGVPDLRGVWNSGWIVNMADGRYAEKTVDVPFTDWGRKLWEERTGNLQKNDPNMQCTSTASSQVRSWSSKRWYSPRAKAKPATASSRRLP